MTDPQKESKQEYQSFCDSNIFKKKQELSRKKRIPPVRMGESLNK